MKRRTYGLTIIELLTVVAVIAILIGLLLPATTLVRNYAKNTAQRAQFSAINLGLEAFKSDFGYYPASNAINGYGGAQKLAEAMLGLDLLGYNPEVELGALSTDGITLNHLNAYSVTDPNTNAIALNNRKDRYLELESANVFRLGEDRTNLNNIIGGLYQDTDTLSPVAQVLCDIYEKTTVRHGNGTTERAGAPILYYRANTSKKAFRTASLSELNYPNSIYNVNDNAALVDLRSTREREKNSSRFNDPLNGGDTRSTEGLIPIADFFYGTGSAPTVYGYVQDPKVSSYPWPCNPETYILISAGLDGLYGTDDDIRNFGN